jgi:hypothetical protein
MRETSGDSASLNRERSSLQQLQAVAKARQLRLETERQELAQRERQLAAAEAAQANDEALVGQQRAAWTDVRRAWASRGGALGEALAMRQDKEVLLEMEAMVARQREALRQQADHLQRELRAWTSRYQAARAFRDALAARKSKLLVNLERASERQRDEEALMVLASVAANTQETV